MIQRCVLNVVNVQTIAPAVAGTKRLGLKKKLNRKIEREKEGEMNHRQLWIIIIVLAIVIFLAIGLALWLMKFQSNETAPSPAISQKIEAWVKNSTKLFENVTSTDTLKIDDGTFRMYFQKDGKIVYADSKDAATFSDPASTGIDENPGKFNSNPTVLKIKENDWIMIYEEQPQLPPGAEKGPGPGTQRNLLLATSEDGKTFTKAGIAIDSSKEDQYFASVPKLIKLPGSKIRMYYVSEGDKIASAISDDGKTWTREKGFRLEDSAVDPDPILKVCCGGTQNWVMYFATLEGNNNKFYKATSKDGINWQRGEIVLRPNSEKGAIVDPDVVEIAANKWRMFFGEMAEGEGQMGGSAQIDLYYADFEGDIFE